MIKRWSVVMVIFLLTVNNIYSQNYDLLVTVKNDSIACNIDSISGNIIYFEMRYDKKWIHTSYNKELVTDYQQNSINRKKVSFKRGTSYIHNPNYILSSQFNRNIVFGTASYFLYHYTLTLNVERILYLSENTNKIWSFRVGYGIIDNKGKILIGTFNNLRGSSKNKLEMNIGATYINELHSYGPNFISIVLNAGYRLQSPDGKLVFRTGIGTPEGLYLSLGYSF